MAMFNSYVSLPEGKHVESEESKTANVMTVSNELKILGTRKGFYKPGVRAGFRHSSFFV